MKNFIPRIVSQSLRSAAVLLPKVRRPETRASDQRGEVMARITIYGTPSGKVHVTRARAQDPQ